MTVFMDAALINEGPYLLNIAALRADNAATNDLAALADALLGMRPVSVMDKDRVAPSGDKHDWVNLADYSWPNPDSPDGLPYVTRDGQANPEARLYDRRRFNQLVISILRLGAAWKSTGRTRYAGKTIELIHHWFINAATAMNPHLRYAHHVPGGAPGRSDGLIVFCSALPSLLDVWLALRRAGLIDQPMHTALCAWTESFLHWLLTDPLSVKHGRAANNHGSYHDFLLTYLMLFVGRPEKARDLLRNALSHRLSTQIEVTGEQPMETKRTLSAQYCMYNLKALMSLAKLAAVVGLDGWRRDAAQPEILRATAFLYRSATGETAWPYPQIEPPNWWFLAPLCVAANRSYGHAFDITRIPLDVPEGAFPIDPVVFTPGWELLFAPSHQQHLPDGVSGVEQPPA
jgi:hypothetical protein